MNIGNGPVHTKLQIFLSYYYITLRWDDKLLSGRHPKCAVNLVLWLYSYFQCYQSIRVYKLIGVLKSFNIRCSECIDRVEHLVNTDIAWQVILFYINGVERTNLALHKWLQLNKNTPRCKMLLLIFFFFIKYTITDWKLHF